MKRYGIPALAFAIIVTIGCGGGQPQSASKAFGAPAAVAGKAEPAAASIDRKIRYTANVEIVVKNLDATQDSLETLLKSKNGYIAKSELTGSVGDRRHGTWSIKIPVEHFRDVVNAISSFGTLVRNSSDSEDFTEEFLDLEARLRNLKAEEDVLNKLLKDGTTRLDDVLKMREQILKNRGEIERSEGRLKYLASVTSFSTINLTVREIQDYVPPKTPSFGSDVSDSFEGSTASLWRFFRGVLLVAVAIAPWLPMILIAGFVLWKLSRRVSIRTSGGRVEPGPAEEPSPNPSLQSQGGEEE